MESTPVEVSDRQDNIRGTGWRSFTKRRDELRAIIAPRFKAAGPRFFINRLYEGIFGSLRDGGPGLYLPAGVFHGLKGRLAWCESRPIEDL
jgi:hypothetical protein